MSRRYCIEAMYVCLCACHVGAFDDDDDDDIILQHLAVGLCLHVGIKQSDTEVRFHTRGNTLSHTLKTTVLTFSVTALGSGQESKIHKHTIHSKPH